MCHNLLFAKKGEAHGRSGLSTWKYQFSYNHWSQATLSSVSTWMGSCSSVVWVLLLTLKVGYIWLAVLYCVDAELAIGQCRLGVHRTCGLINPWHHLQKMSSWVGNPGRPPYVIPCGSAGLKKEGSSSICVGLKQSHAGFVCQESHYF